MTREEREAFVRRTWFGEGTAADAVTKIVDAWEDEISEARTDAMEQGRSIGWQERGDFGWQERGD